MTQRILHLGLGAFHRAHQAVYLQKLHDAGDRSWTLASGNIRPDDEALVAALARSGGAYMLETVSPSGERKHETIRSIGAVLPWDEDLRRRALAERHGRTLRGPVWFSYPPWVRFV